MEKVIQALIGVQKALNKVTKVKYSDYYFLYKRLEARIKFIDSTVEMPRMNSSRQYLQYGD